MGLQWRKGERRNNCGSSELIGLLNLTICHMPRGLGCVSGWCTMHSLPVAPMEAIVDVVVVVRVGFDACHSLKSSGSVESLTQLVRGLYTLGCHHDLDVFVFVILLMLGLASSWRDWHVPLVVSSRSSWCLRLRCLRACHNYHVTPEYQKPRSSAWTVTPSPSSTVNPHTTKETKHMATYLSNQWSNTNKLGAGTVFGSKILARSM